jgi:hypothetical protein
MCVFPFAGNGDSHSQQRREGKKKARQICPFPVIVSSGAWTHAPPVATARGETRRYCSGSSISLPDTVLLVQKAIPVILDCFGANFCNVKIV